MKRSNCRYRGFSRDCPNGTLSKADFEKMYKDYFPFGDARKYAQYVFRHLDTKQDDKVDFDEFIRVCFTIFYLGN